MNIDCRLRNSVKIRAGALAFVVALLWAMVACDSAVPAAPTAATIAVPSPALTADASGDWSLVSHPVDALPTMDGKVEAAWAHAEVVRLPLQWGLDGEVHALDVELRALHTQDAICFLAQWPGPAPAADKETISNKFVAHWPIPQQGEAGRDLNCMVACHTAFADGAGRFTYVSPETIPTGASASLPFAGGWKDGLWTLEWSRPLVNDNPFDLQFLDLSQSYRFFVKIFEGIEGRADPISDWCLLTFGAR